jgi:hypothetical protein
MSHITVFVGLDDHQAFLQRRVLGEVGGVLVPHVSVSGAIESCC